MTAYEIGQRVHSFRVGACKEFTGEIVSIVDDPRWQFVVLRDDHGRSWHRSFNEIKPLEEVAA